MPNVRDWEPEWVCKCGANWRARTDDWAFFESSPLSRDRFMAFGFDRSCPKCGGNLGSQGPEDQVRCEIVRYTGGERMEPFRLFRPSTWRAVRTPLVREVKE